MTRVIGVESEMADSCSSLACSSVSTTATTLIFPWHVIIAGVVQGRPGPPPTQVTLEKSVKLFLCLIKQQKKLVKHLAH